MISEINTIEDVKLFAYQLVNEEDLNFHPDTDFSDYINTETGKPLYSIEEIQNLNRLMENCFDICEQNGADIYDLMSEPLFLKLKIGKFAGN
jgi:hypothetical protein